MADTPDWDGEAPLELTIPGELAGQRLDKALALLAAETAGLSRSRIAQLMAEGAVADGSGATVREAKRKVKPGEVYCLEVPPPLPAEPEPEATPLEVVFEDAELIVVNKPAGMVVHPAPGAERGTLVNALLHHCGDSLTGIGGARRPGIVHRIDKDTSGLLVAAKTEAAHGALSALFAAHDIERSYLGIAWGAPDRADPRLAGLRGVSFEAGGWLRVEAALGRHPVDRKRMAVRPDGRRAVTRLRARERFGPHGRPFASLLDCRLETGRTHQIRVHAAHIGHALVGDPVYGRARAISRNDATEIVVRALQAFPRQALHAASLGFPHPVTAERLHFEAAVPADMAGLLELLRSA